MRTSKKREPAPGPARAPWSGPRRRRRPPRELAALLLALVLARDAGEHVVDRRKTHDLAAGDPPFAEALRNAVAGYVRGRPEKAFLIRGLSAAAIGNRCVVHLALDSGAAAAKAMRVLKALK